MDSAVNAGSPNFDDMYASSIGFISCSVLVKAMVIVSNLMVMSVASRRP